MRLEAIPPWLSPMLLTPCSIWIGIGAALRDHAGLFGTAIAQDNLLTVTVPAQRPLPYFGPNSKLSVERCFGRMRAMVAIEQDITNRFEESQLGGLRKPTMGQSFPT